MSGTKGVMRGAIMTTVCNGRINGMGWAWSKVLSEDYSILKKCFRRHLISNLER